MAEKHSQSETPNGPAASGYQVSDLTAGRAQQSPGGLGGFLAHGDVYSGFTSSNVAAAQFDPHENYLQVGFNNGGWYGYHDVTTKDRKSVV